MKISEDFRIGAARTITSDNIPLYILDGEIISDNKMKKLDPNSIEKVEVLKGASATALYGSRAQNGAIIITSKKYLKGRESKILGK